MHLWTQSKGCMYQGMLQSKGKALLEEGMEIPEERASLSSPYTPRFHSQTPVARCSSSPGPLCCGNYCSSLGKWDLHLCCNYSRTSTAKGSKGAGEAAMGSLPSQQQAHSEDHTSCKQPAQPQPCSYTLTHSHTHKHSHSPPFGVLLAIAGATAGHLALHVGSHPFPSLNLCLLPSPFAGPAAGLLSAVTRSQPSWGEFCCCLVAP